MTEITIVQIENQLVVDSRIVAEQLSIEHESFIRLIKKHKAKLEDKFGVFRFEVGKPLEGSQRGRPNTFAWLNEGQTTALLTLSRNTDLVVDLKFNLVEKFQAQKKQLENPVDRALFAELADRLSKLEAQTLPALPALPEITKPTLARKLVNEQAAQTGLQHQLVWRQAYAELDYRFGYDIRKKTCKSSKLKRIEEDGHLDNLIAIMQNLWTPNTNT
jgi:phage regulator Rha-like protein